MIAKTATFEVRPDAVDDARAAIESFVAAVRENEPDTVFYTAFQDAETPSRFVHFFAFASAEAEEHHRTTPWVKAFTGVLYPTTVDGVTFTDHTLVATTI